MQNVRVCMCLNFGKFSQVRAMYVWPKIRMCGCACVREFVRNRGPLKLPNVLHKVNHLAVFELVRVCLFV